MDRPEITNFAKIILLIEFLFVAYMLYALTSSIYQSYQIDRHIAVFEEENKKIAEENKKLSEDFEYYDSDAYLEKFAKQNLGLVNAGEKVIILPEGEATTFELADQLTNKNLTRWNRNSMPEKWRRFFFENQRL